MCYGLGEAKVFTPRSFEHKRIDTLEMQIGDTLMIPVEKRDGIPSTVGVMPRIETETHQIGIRIIQKTSNLILGFDPTVGMRVK